jgi:hypothetical protein
MPEPELSTGFPPKAKRDLATSYDVPGRARSVEHAIAASVPASEEAVSPASSELHATSTVKAQNDGDARAEARA